jgi:hypothetical protein
MAFSVRIITALAVGVLSCTSWGQTSKKGNAQWAVVISEGAMVYAEPDFDADVLGYLQEGQKIAVSKKPMGPFYKVRTDDIPKGYIASTDVKVAGKEKTLSKGKKKDSKKSENPFFDTDKRTKDITDSRFVGGFLSLHLPQENYNGATQNGTQTFFGFRFSSPDMISWAPFLADVNLGVSMAPPSYYAPGASAASGYAVWADVAALLPLSESKDMVWYIGGGPLIGYQSVRVLRSQTYQDFNNFKLGADLLVGVGYRVEKVLVRLDLKYFWETNFYPAATLGVQHQF